MGRCLNDRDIVLLAGNQQDKKEYKRLLRHVKSCQDCRRKLEDYRKALDEFEDLIRLNGHIST